MHCSDTTQTPQWKLPEKKSDGRETEREPDGRETREIERAGGTGLVIAWYMGFCGEVESI